MDDLLTFGDPYAREAAEWYPIDNDLDHYKRIAVENLNETRHSYGRVAENMEDAEMTLALRTRYQYAYQPPTKDNVHHIKYRGKFYEIKEVRPRELGTLGLYHPKEYVLILIEVNYDRDFARAD